MTTTSSTLLKRPFLIKDNVNGDVTLIQVFPSTSVKQLIDTIVTKTEMMPIENYFLSVKDKDICSYKSLIDIPFLSEGNEYSEITVIRSKEFKIQLYGRPSYWITQKFHSGVELQHVKELMHKRCPELCTRTMIFFRNREELSTVEEFMKLEDGQTVTAALLYTINVKCFNEEFILEEVKSLDISSSILSSVEEVSVLSIIDKYIFQKFKKKRRKRYRVEYERGSDSGSDAPPKPHYIEHDSNSTIGDEIKQLPLNVDRFSLILEIETLFTIHLDMDHEEVLRSIITYSNNDIKKILSSNPQASEGEHGCSIMWGSQPLNGTTIASESWPDIHGCIVHLSRKIRVFLEFDKSNQSILMRKPGMLEVTDDIQMDKFLSKLQMKVLHKLSSELVFECNGKKLEATSECIYQHGIRNYSTIRVYEEKHISCKYMNKVYEYVFISHGDSFNEIVKKTNDLIKTVLPCETIFECVCGRQLSNAKGKSRFSLDCCTNRSKCLTLITPVKVRILGKNGFFTTERFHSTATVKDVVDQVQQRNGKKARQVEDGESNILDQNQTLDSMVNDDDEITIHIEFEMSIIVNVSNFNFIWNVWPSQTLWEVIKDLNKYSKEKLGLQDDYSFVSLCHMRYGEEMEITPNDRSVCLQDGVTISLRQNSIYSPPASLHRETYGIISEEESRTSKSLPQQMSIVKKNLKFSKDSDRMLKVSINNKEYYVQVPDRIKPGELAYFFRRNHLLHRQSVVSIVVHGEKETHREDLPSQKMWNQHFEVTADLSMRFNTKNTVFMIILFTPFRRSQSFSFIPRDLANIIKEINDYINQTSRCHEKRIWYSQVGRYFSEEKEHGVATVFGVSQGTVFVSDSRIVGSTKPMQTCRVTVTNILPTDEPFIPIVGTPKIEVYLFTKFYHVSSPEEFLPLDDGFEAFRKYKYIAYIRGMVKKKNDNDKEAVHYVNTVSGNYFEVVNGEKFSSRTTEKGKIGYFGHSVYLIDERSFLKFGDIPPDERVKVFVRDGTEVEFVMGRFRRTKYSRSHVNDQRWFILENNHPVHAAMRNYSLNAKK